MHIMSKMPNVMGYYKLFLNIQLKICYRMTIRAYNRGHNIIITINYEFC